MERLPQEIIDEINALEGMRADRIMAKYGHLLGDAEHCHSAAILRQLVIYRLQEKFYGIKLSKQCRDWMERESPGATLGIKDKGVGAGARLVRYWKGEKHEVLVRDDGTYEHSGMVFKSLSAVARAITGTQWNGKLFFGVK